MPRYHFHVHDEKGLLDEEGIDLPDFGTAQLEAIRLAGGMLLDEASLIHSHNGWHLSVMDSDGKPLLRVDVDVINMTTLN
ncbi:MAG: DUF6894 family protein [Janthinobacterium lividum]